MKGWQYLKKNTKSGISMALVLCVSAFFVAFAAAIIYTAGMVTSQSNQRLKEERCYQLAKSYSNVLSKNLTKYEQKYDNDGNFAANGTFYTFANKFLDSSKYLEYNSDYKESTTYHFVLSDTELSDLFESPLDDEEYGNITISMKKELNSGENMDDITRGGALENVSSGVDYTSTISSIENTAVRQYNLIVDVTSYYENVSYTYSTEYTREEKYRVSFKCGSDDIVWDSNTKTWKLGNTAGAEYQVPSGGTITYEYLTGSPTLSKFEENRIQGGGDSGESDTD